MHGRPTTRAGARRDGKLKTAGSAYAGLPVTAELAAAIESRVAELKARGGECSAYGAVLEGALTSARLFMRMYMWRVDGRWTVAGLNDKAPARNGWGFVKGAGDGLLSRDLSIGVPSAL